jgi:hypothetical protein
MVPAHNAQVCLLVSQGVLTLYEKVLPLVLSVPGLKEQEVQQHAALLVRPLLSEQLVPQHPLQWVMVVVGHPRELSLVTSEDIAR